MAHLFVGVCEISLIFRYAQSLKDRRQPMQSLMQKLRNNGFTVTDSSENGDMKTGVIGAAFVGHTHAQIEREFQEMEKLLIGDFQLAGVKKDIFDYSQMEDKPLSHFEEDAPWDKD